MNIKLLFPLFLILTIALHVPVFSQNISISGYVRDDQSGEFLPGALVTAGEEKPVRSFTNNDGFYSLKHSKTDSITVVVSCYSYYTVYIKVPGRENTVLNVALNP